MYKPSLNQCFNEFNDVYVIKLQMKFIHSNRFYIQISMELYMFTKFKSGFQRVILVLEI